ncbi:MAG: DMT family transporter [Chitinophagales bacterium]|nr:DMT family transporter [Chitinophagales bacterium]
MSTFFFALMNVFIKKVGHIPAMEIVFFRCFVSLLLCVALLYKQGVGWRGSNRKLLLARGIFGTIALYTFFITLREMPLGTAVTIQYLSPVFTTIIAIFLLKEYVHNLQWLFFLLSFSGIVFIKGFDSRVSILMLGIGIVSAIASAFAYNMVRSLKEKEHAVVVVLHFQLIGTIAGLFFSIFNWKMPVGWDWFYLLLIGVFTQLGQINLTKALQMEKIANVSILNYLGVVYALLFGYMFFDEHYEPVALVGIALVLCGVVLNYFYTRSKSTPVIEELTNVDE